MLEFISEVIMKFNKTLIMITISTLTVLPAFAGMNGYILPQQSHVTKHEAKKIVKPSQDVSSGYDKEKIYQPPVLTEGMDNLTYIKSARESALQMFMKATQMYRSSKITKEKYIEVSLQYAQWEDYYANIDLNNINSEKNTAYIKGASDSTVESQASRAAQATQATASVPGAIPTIKTASGNSTVLTCPADYMTYTTNNDTVCVRAPRTSTGHTATPGNRSIEPTNGRDCSAGYVLSSASGATVCEPLITEISPGVFRCAWGTEQVPEAGPDGLMRCVSKFANDDGSTKTCGTGDAATTQGCVVGYFYNKKMQRYYPTKEAGDAAYALSQETRSPSSAGVTETATNIPSGRQSEIAALYTSILGRPADTSGLKFWNESGENIDSIRKFLLDSDEYKNKK